MRRGEIMRRDKRQELDEKRERIIERLVGGCDIPPELLSGGCFVELRGRNSITVRGCKRIVKYSTEVIVLKMKSDCMEITGKRLVCLTYTSGGVLIEGIVDGIRFVRSGASEA